MTSDLLVVVAGEAAAVVFAVGGFYAVTRSTLRELRSEVAKKADRALEEAQRKADSATVEALARDVERKAEREVVIAEYGAILRELASVREQLRDLTRALLGRERSHE